MSQMVTKRHRKILNIGFASQKMFNFMRKVGVLQIGNSLGLPFLKVHKAVEKICEKTLRNAFAAIRREAVESVPRTSQ